MHGGGVCHLLRLLAVVPDPQVLAEIGSYPFQGPGVPSALVLWDALFAHPAGRRSAGVGDDHLASCQCRRPGAT